MEFVWCDHTDRPAERSECVLFFSFFVSLIRMNRSGKRTGIAFICAKSIAHSSCSIIIIIMVVLRVRVQWCVSPSLPLAPLSLYLFRLFHSSSSSRVLFARWKCSSLCLCLKPLKAPSQYEWNVVVVVGGATLTNLEKRKSRQPSKWTVISCAGAPQHPFHWYTYIRMKVLCDLCAEFGALMCRLSSFSSIKSFATRHIHIGHWCPAIITEPIFHRLNPKTLNQRRIKSD